MPPFVESQTSGETPIDHRHPLYLGTWKRSIPGIDDDFAKDDMDEPHLKRKFAILNSHPEVEKLYSLEGVFEWLREMPDQISRGVFTNAQRR